MKRIIFFFILFVLISDSMAHATAPVAVFQMLTCAPNAACPVVLSTSGGTAPLSYTVTTNPVHGTLSGAAPNLVYTPNQNYWGNDQFNFKVTDSQGNSSASSIALAVAALVKNSDAVGVKTTGAWDNYSSMSPSGSWAWGGNYLYFNPANETYNGQSVTFTANLPDGVYDVYAWCFRNWASSLAASNIPVDITHGSGSGTSQTDTAIFSEQGPLGAFWVLLGTASQHYVFNSGTPASVKIRTDGINGIVTANAVEFVYVKPIPASVPVAPSNLSAQFISAAPGTAAWKESTQLSWANNATTDIDGIDVEQSTDNVNFSRVEALPLTQNMYYITALLPNTTYYYRIGAYNVQGYSYSNTASVTTPAPSTDLDSALTDRRMDWSQAGVIQPDGTKGIPHRTSICANVRQAPYNASASAYSTTGSLTANSNQLVLPVKSDFTVGQGIYISNGQPTVASFSPPSPPSGTTNLVINMIATQGISNIPVTSAMTPTQIADAIRNIGATTKFYGWKTDQNTGTDTVTFTSVNIGYPVPTYAYTQTPVTSYNFTMASMATIVAPSLDLNTTVTTVSADGLTLTLQKSSTNSISNVAVTHDDGLAIQSAIDQCPANQVVYIPAGTYGLKSGLRIASSITLRGDGPGKTILLDEIGVGQTVIAVGDSSASGVRPILSGYTKGSTSITSSSLAGIAGVDRQIQKGDLLRVYEQNPSGLVYVTGGWDNQIAQTVYVTNVDTTTNTISFMPPLYWTYQSALHPSFIYRYTVVSFAGIEDLTVTHLTNVGKLWSIMFDGTYGCWLKNIESSNAQAFDIFFTNDVSGEITGSFIHNEQGFGPNHGGIVFYNDVDNFLVDNNTITMAYPSIEVDTRSSGDVFAYNYSDYVLPYGTNTQLGGDLDTNHGPHNMMDLWEGNRGIQFQSDSYYGSASHITAFRNWFTGTDSDSSQPDFRIAATINRWSYDFNLIGNILGTPNYQNNVPAPPLKGMYDIEIPEYSYSQPVIYRLGYPNVGNTWFSGTDPAIDDNSTLVGAWPNPGPAFNPAGLDLKVKATLLRHGNFDYVTNSTIWDPYISDHTLTSSLYLTNKPSFLGSKPWPMIGPDIPGLIADTLPAQDRYTVVTAPVSPDATAPTIPTGLTASLVSAGQVNLSWEISWDNVGVAGYKVYRDGTVIATVDNSQHMNTQYTDTVADSNSHTYTVSAIDAVGNESAHSAQARIGTLAGGLLGDVSGDGNVTIYDAALTAQYAVGLITFTSDQLQKGDVSGDGNVTIYDAALIAQRSVGLIAKFPVEP